MARIFVMCFLAGEVKANARAAVQGFREPVKVEFHRLTRRKTEVKLRMANGLSDERKERCWIWCLWCQLCSEDKVMGKLGLHLHNRQGKQLLQALALGCNTCRGETTKANRRSRRRTAKMNARAYHSLPSHIHGESASGS